MLVAVTPGFRLPCSTASTQPTNLVHGLALFCRIGGRATLWLGMLLVLPGRLWAVYVLVTAPFTSSIIALAIRRTCSAPHFPVVHGNFRGQVFWAYGVTHSASALYGV